MKIPEEVGSKYRLIILGGQRVSQLQKGAKPRTEAHDGHKLTEIAMEELVEGKLVFRKKTEASEDENVDPEVGEKVTSDA